MSFEEDVDNLPLAPLLTDPEICALSQFLYESAIQQGILLQNLGGTSLIDENSGSAPVYPQFAAELDDPSYYRPHNILNSFAFVCAKEESSAQYMAMSAAIGQKVQVCIAQNWEKPGEEVKIHLEGLWTHLQCIAYVRHYIRCENESERRGWDVEVEEPSSGVKEVSTENPNLNGSMFEDVPSESAKPVLEQILSKTCSARDPDLIVHEELRKTFMHNVQVFCYPKTKRRIQKYLAPGISQIYKYYFGDNNGSVNHEDVLAKIIHTLYYISQIVMLNFNEANPENLPRLVWSQLLHLFRVLHHRYVGDTEKILAQARQIMRAWDNLQEVKGGISLGGFDLVKAIYKIAELGSHVHELLDFSYSPRRHAILQKDIEIILLEPIVVPAPRSISQSETTRLARLLFDSTRYPVENFYETMLSANERQARLVHATLLARVSSVSVHPEMALLIHHHRCAAERSSESKVGVTPFQYIAVNGTPCICCCSAFEAYSIATGRSFILRSENPIICAPWWPASDLFGPDLSPVLKRIFYWNMLGVYADQLCGFGEPEKQDEFVDAPSDNSHSVALPKDDLDKKKKKKGSRTYSMTRFFIRGKWRSRR